jgi:hypothetical protein
VVRESTLVADALDRLRTTMPFPLRGIDSDNSSEFINETVLAYCGTHGIEFTRSRPIARTTRRGWSRRTARRGAVSSATVASKDCVRSKRSRGCIPPRGCS